MYPLQSHHITWVRQPPDFPSRTYHNYGVCVCVCVCVYAYGKRVKCPPALRRSVCITSSRPTYNHRRDGWHY